MQMTHSNQTEQMIGDGVRVSVHRKPACEIEMHVAANKDLIEKGRKNAVKNVGREVTLPGFRKGKAPEEIVLRKFPQEVEKELRNCVADVAFQEAQKVAKVVLLNGNSRIVFDVKAETPESMEFIFRFETEPTVPSVDPQLFKPSPVEKVQVEEKHIDEAIRQMAFFYAEWENIEDRAVQEKDFIIIDLDTVDGDKVEKVFNQVRFEVVPERMAHWMRRLVLNAKAGDVVEGMSEPDDTASQQEKEEFKPKKVRVHIVKVERAVLPEMNDEFAKQVGAPDVEGMRRLVADVLRRQVEEKEEAQFKEQVNQFLVSQYDFDLPASLLKAEIDHRKAKTLDSPKAKTYWETLSAEEKKQREATLLLETRSSLKLFYLARQVIRDEKIPVTQQEVQEKAVSNHQAVNPGSEEIAKEEYAAAFSNVLLAKAQDFILSKQKA